MQPIKNYHMEMSAGNTSQEFFYKIIDTFPLVCDWLLDFKAYGINGPDKRKEMDTYVQRCQSMGVTPFQRVEFYNENGIFVPQRSVFKPDPVKNIEKYRRAYANGVIKGGKPQNVRISATACDPVRELRELAHNLGHNGFELSMGDLVHANSRIHFDSNGLRILAYHPQIEEWYYRTLQKR